ncbi:Proteasome subunit beta type-2-A [Bienertia sinuspersici]
MPSLIVLFFILISFSSGIFHDFLNVNLQNPYSVNILLAGYDNESGPSLYFIDYIATLHKVDKAAFGYGSYFSLSMMDRHYHKDMSLDEAIKLVDECIAEIKTRLVVAPPNFVIKIVDKDGAREYAWRETIKEKATDSPDVTAASA